MDVTQPPAHPRTAVITGAARGIGLETATRLVREGYRVALVDRDPLVRDSAAGLPAGSAVAVTVDIGTPDAPQAIAEAVKHWSPPSVLVNNAGISPKVNGRSNGLLQIEQAEWDLVMNVNLYAAFRMCKHFIPGMREMGWGRIVNVASLAGRSKSIVAGATYMASKAALLGLSRSIASQFGLDGITCNSVAPGRVDTLMGAAGGAGQNTDYATQIPVGRIGKAHEIAAAIVYLASEDAGFVNGAVIDLNGGFFMA
ncbi:SDR family oxidoreductase [Ramlibacter algicola]|uniref:SDR family oxidoreductase n=1 Tax=Ramlibacter algicola TaxID=2795217 RepID=A0A934Q2B7_9BURK|nr:SDR family oxidoreductase [Ramlibacter algicola]MBK0393765.1 SDR family oxidoreductase [Ramlibacter algicola]